MKGAQEGALTERLVGVVRARLDFRGKVFDPPNVVFWQQKAAHLRHIQPFIGCALDTSIVEVETVNVDVCFHKSLNTETAVRRPRTGFANYYRGYASIITRVSAVVKRKYALIVRTLFS